MCGNFDLTLISAMCKAAKCLTIEVKPFKQRKLFHTFKQGNIEVIVDDVRSFIGITKCWKMVRIFVQLRRHGLAFVRFCVVC